MLTIREEQMAAFEELRMADFLRELREFLGEILARKGVAVTPELLTGEVDALMQKARRFHLKREKDIARVGELLCLNWGGISGAALTRKMLGVLYTYGMDPEEKLRRFEETIPRT